MNKKIKRPGRISGHDPCYNNKQSKTDKENKNLVQSIFDHHPVWQLKYLDWDHNDWGWRNLEKQMVFSILGKLKSYESRTWGEIWKDKKRDHSVALDQLTPEARKRLQEINQDDVDTLFRLRLSGEQRVWGILDRYIFRILWWDSDHSVCLSYKKNT